MPHGDCDKDAFDAALAKALVGCHPRTDKEILAIVEDVLEEFGIDHTHWEEVSEVRKDMAWVREARVRCDVVKNNGLGSVATAIVMAVMALLALGAKVWLWP